MRNLEAGISSVKSLSTALRRSARKWKAKRRMSMPDCSLNDSSRTASSRVLSVSCGKAAYRLKSLTARWLMSSLPLVGALS